MKCSKFCLLINFQSLNRHWSVLLSHIALQLDREGIKGREDGERGMGGGGLFEGGNFYIFPSNGGNYLRERINQGTAIILGNMVNPILCSDCWHFEQAGWICLNLPTQDFLHCSHKKNVKSLAHNKSFIDLAWGQDGWMYICLIFFFNNSSQA